MFNNSTVFIEIDWGDIYSMVVSLDQGGEVVEESRIPTTKNPFNRKFRSFPSCRIALEVSTCSRWVCQMLKHLGHEDNAANRPQGISIEVFDMVTKLLSASALLDKTAEPFLKLSRAIPCSLHIGRPYSLI
jgi:hypothetical protein